MKYERADTFKRDYTRLSKQHREKFRDKATTQFHDAADRAAKGEDNPWPNAMRVKAVQGHPGVWEMTWSENNPDGRATWEWVTIKGESAVRWRRVGTHSIFTDP